MRKQATKAVLDAATAAAISKALEKWEIQKTDKEVFRRFTMRAPKHYVPHYGPAKDPVTGEPKFSGFRRRSPKVVKGKAAVKAARELRRMLREKNGCHTTPNDDGSVNFVFESKRSQTLARRAGITPS